MWKCFFTCLRVGQSIRYNRKSRKKLGGTKVLIFNFLRAIGLFNTFGRFFFCKNQYRVFQVSAR